MSLLNDMLYDLARQKLPSPAAPYQPVLPTEMSDKSKKYLVWGGIAGACSVALLVSLWPSSKPMKEVTVASAAVITPAQPIAMQVQEVQLVSYIVPLSAYARQWVEIRPAMDFSNQMNTATIQKTLAPPTIEEWHEDQLNKALHAIHRGDDDRAIALLQGLLDKLPQAIDARENLASLYLSYGDLENAKDVSETGLKYAPDNANLLTIKGRLLMAQERYEEAKMLLSNHHPNMSSYPDYYGTLAAAMQALGEVDEAGSLYKALLQVIPDNGQYWLGYAIFLENRHKINEAIDAYNRANQNPDSEAVVKEYALNRITHLQG